MPDDAPHFDDRGRLIAPKYEDVYFSAVDGLAETRHVFLAGNRLAERFSAMKPGERFTIGETGFGTGLNFLAAWQLFEQHAPGDAQLDFVSVEGFPLDCQTMRRALSSWSALERFCDALLQQWGPLWPGVHRFRFAEGRVRLTLLVGEVVGALGSVDASCDAWFLDGFAPSRNPAMWSDAIFAEVARLSAPGATLATYTAAGFVRRGLAAVGFEIQKRPGFGTKRDMTAGRLLGSADDKKWGGHSCLPSGAARSAIVIGGSLAGSFVARSLAERGFAVNVIERQPLCAGQLPSLQPRVSVLQPKVSDINDAAGRWLREGFATALRRLVSDPALQRRADWFASGSFQAAHNERAEKRLRRFVQQFGASGLCRWIDSNQTRDELGIDLPVGGLVIEGGMLLPAGLCRGLLEHASITVLDNMAVKALHADAGRWRIQVDGANAGIDADAVVVANAIDAFAFEQTRHLELRSVRGQVTTLRASSQAGSLQQLKRPLFYGGYVLPDMEGALTVGASFVPGDQDTAWRREEHDAYCEKLGAILPQEASMLKSLEGIGGWAGIRTTTPTHRCYAKAIEPNLYVSLGHGSHGIASAARAAEHIADLITGGVVGQ